MILIINWFTKCWSGLLCLNFTGERYVEFTTRMLNHLLGKLRLVSRQNLHFQEKDGATANNYRRSQLPSGSWLYLYLVHQISHWNISRGFHKETDFQENLRKHWRFKDCDEAKDSWNFSVESSLPLKNVQRNILNNEVVFSYVNTCKFNLYHFW